jgi:peptide/nickel transport system ATP-binding protein
VSAGAVATVARPDVLRVRDLTVHYHTPAGVVKAADGVSFTLATEERLGLAGESGSGKSTLALAILRLIKPPGKIEGGDVSLDGVSLMTLSEEEMRQRRLAAIALVPQGSMNSLNPVLRIQDQIGDALRDHEANPGQGARLDRRQVRERAHALLASVGLRPEVADRYPHELSGGMKQRACIAIAISLRPKVIVADEPTSALDVVVQKQVMETLARVQRQLGAAVILVGHDMGLMAQFVDRLGVMYAGRLVELSPVPEVFTQPLHPYTRLLIRSLPSLERKGALQGIPGLPPPLRALPPGCAFHPRCPDAVDRCRTERPALREVRAGAFTACHLA